MIINQVRAVVRAITRPDRPLFRPAWEWTVTAIAARPVTIAAGCFLAASMVPSPLKLVLCLAGGSLLGRAAFRR